MRLVVVVSSSLRPFDPLEQIRALVQVRGDA